MSGNGHSQLLVFTKAPERVVCLVPSMTESIIDLGAGEYLAGATDFCAIPEKLDPHIVRVGGTKTVDIDAVLDLDPELVIANQEENSREIVEAIEGQEVKVWVTFPRSVGDAIEILWILSRLFRIEDRASPKILTLEMTLDWATNAAIIGSPVRVFCPIWQGEDEDWGLWWMTFNRETYSHDLLYRCGGLNVFADRERRYPLGADIGERPGEDPGARDTRYPRVGLAEVLNQAPEVILIPDGHFDFVEEDQARLKDVLSDTPAVQNGRVHLVDGRLITWHGTRLARTLAEIPSFLQP